VASGRSDHRPAQAEEALEFPFIDAQMSALRGNPLDHPGIVCAANSQSSIRLDRRAAGNGRSRNPVNPTISNDTDQAAALGHFDDTRAPVGQNGDERGMRLARLEL
jgi:hypothetical protein